MTKQIELFILLVYLFNKAFQSNDFCSIEDKSCSTELNNSSPRFLFYEVNYSEGFNLRRDVFMRLAIFMHTQRKENQDWHLVLPPWPHLYHWKSKDVSNQNFLPWSNFFDIGSLKRFSPVMEYEEYLQGFGNNKIDVTYVLQHFEGAFSDKNWNWDDRYTVVNCGKKVICLEQTDCKQSSYILAEGSYYGFHWSYENITANALHCISFQGPASFLKQILDKDKSSKIMLDHAEIVVHNRFGDQLYWKCRRSMRFAPELVKEADMFRIKYLGCNDSRDNTLRPQHWENEQDFRNAIGGPFICAHLRRGDFVYGRGNQLPSMKYAAIQLRKLLYSLKLETVFLATDAFPEDVNILKENLKNAKLVQYKPVPEVKSKIKDGGVAIVDQIICSYGRYFIGTYESTFTFRIQEEREIIGFPVNTTFNVFCSRSSECFETNRWTIVY